ncbi:hypothetical protein [Streptomyces ipomoeae]
MLFGASAWRMFVEGVRGLACGRANAPP